MKTVRRVDYLWRVMLEDGVSPFLLNESINSVALSHEEGWLDVMVNYDTGEEVDDASR